MRIGPVGRSGMALAFVFASCAVSGRAQAGDEAAAEALFVEGKKLAAQGKYAEACPKFAESNRLDRGAGTLIHLGNCYEKNRQTASAWATYKEAASAAQALGRKEWEKLASQRAATLEPKLARLTVKVDPATEKIEVSRDGTVVSRASWGVALPVDVGAHVVEATGPGHKPFKATATVTKDGESVEIAVPKLEAEAAGAAPPTAKAALVTTTTTSPSDADKGDGSGQRTIGFIVAGVGVAGIAVGAVTGLMAMSKNSDAKATCPNDGGCASRDAVDASESAQSLGLVSTIGFIAGAACGAAGAALVLTAPTSNRTGARAPLRFAPNAGPSGAGLSVLGVF